MKVVCSEEQWKDLSKKLYAERETFIKVMKAIGEWRACNKSMYCYYCMEEECPLKEVHKLYEQWKVNNAEKV